MATNYIETAIYERALQDPSFRVAVLDNPKKALSDEFDASLPEGSNVKVHEQSEATFHIVLPPEETNEISDEDLATVAGGAAAAQTATFYGTFIEFECIDCG